MYNQIWIQDIIYLHRYYAAIATVIFIFGYLLHEYLKIPKQLRHIPAASLWRYMYALAMKESVRSRTNRFISPLLSKGNGLYLLRVPFDWTVYVANPVLARAVFFKSEYADKATFLMDAFTKESLILHFAGNDNVSVINGKHWKEQRKFRIITIEIMNPAFHRSMPVGVFGSLMPKVFRLIDKSQVNGELISTSDLTRRLTLDALGKASFDFDFGAIEDENNIWVKTYTQGFDAFLEIFPTLFPKLDRIYRALSPERKERYCATFKLIGLLDDMADKKREHLAKGLNMNDVPQSEKDLLTLMLEAQMRGEGSWTKEELRHNMAIFFLAGHDPNSNCLSFCLYHLAHNREIQTKARDEVVSVLGDDPADVFPTLDDCKKFPYLDMIIKETLRLFPPSTEITPRIISQDLNLGGTFLPEGTMINVDIQSLHYHPDLWHNPEQFIPERFSEGGEHASHEGIAWAPFSSGSRQCIGINFTMMEQRVFLSMLLRKYNIMLSPNSIHQNGLILDEAQNIAPASLKLKFNSRY